nr:unnamed protein product [Digitaria exilis]
MAALRLLPDMRNFRHAFFSPSQPCCSANANIVPTELVPTLSSHINFSLSIPYLSAATSKCWAMDMASLSPSSTTSGGSESL